MSQLIEPTTKDNATACMAASEAPSTPLQNELAYEKPIVRTLTQRDLLSAVKKGSKFPARGFAG